VLSQISEVEAERDKPLSSAKVRNSDCKAITLGKPSAAAALLIPPYFWARLETHWPWQFGRPGVPAHISGGGGFVITDTVLEAKFVT
jgi:hypothetical protein